MIFKAEGNLNETDINTRSLYQEISTTAGNYGA
jgi:hypothetical protein